MMAKILDKRGNSNSSFCGVKFGKIFSWLHRPEQVISVSDMELCGYCHRLYDSAHYQRGSVKKDATFAQQDSLYDARSVDIGLLIAFLGVVFIILASRFFNGPDIGHIDGLGLVWIVTIVILMIIGGKWGYVFGEKRGFKRPEPKFL